MAADPIRARAQARHGEALGAVTAGRARPRACLYLRKSRNHGRSAKDKEEISLEYQEERLREWCEREGWDVVAVRAESDMRYFLKARKVLMQVVRECAAGLYDLVLCYDMTRLTDDGNDHGWITVELRDAGARLRLLKDEVPDGPYAGVIRHMQAEGSGDEVDRIRTRTGEGKRKRMHEKKKPLPRPAAYGLIWNHEADPARFPKKEDRYLYLQPKHDDATDVARRILEQLASGQVSAGALVRALNEEGVAGPHGGRWNRAGLAHIARNPAYCGLEVTGRTRRRLEGRGYEERWVRDRQDRADWQLLEVTHRPLATREVWEAAQDALDGRVRAPARAANALAARCLLRGGLATCANCGRPLWTGGQYTVVRERPDTAPAGVTVVYYQCASQHSVTKDAILAGEEEPCAAPAHVRADLLDMAVWRKILDARPPLPPDAGAQAAQAKQRAAALKRNAREQATTRRLLQEGEKRALLQRDPHRRAALEAVNEQSAARLRTLEAEADGLNAAARKDEAEFDRAHARHRALHEHRAELLKCRPWGDDPGRDADMAGLVRALDVRAVVRAMPAGERGAASRGERWAITLDGRAEEFTSQESTTRRGGSRRNAPAPGTLRAALARFSPGPA